MLENFPLELFSNAVSFIIIAVIITSLIKYKKKVAVIDGLFELGRKKQLTPRDKEFISANLNEYNIKLQKQVALLKLTYPAMILVAGIFFVFFDFKEALIHMNIFVVTYIYLYVKKIHYTNYIKFLDDIKI